MGKQRTYGFSAPKLADAYSLVELNALREGIVNDPANANPDHTNGNSIYLYTAAARRKLDALGYAVFFRLKMKRSVCGGGVKAAPLPAKREDASCKVCRDWQQDRHEASYGKCESPERMGGSIFHAGITRADDTCDAFVPKTTEATP